MRKKIIILFLILVGIISFHYVASSYAQEDDGFVPVAQRPAAAAPASTCDARCQAQAYATRTGEGTLSSDCNATSCTLLACSNGLVLEDFTYYPPPNCPVVSSNEDSYYDCPTEPPPPPATPTTPPPPPATPTTPPPACGTPCSGDYACNGAKNNCTSCVNHVCSPPVTPTPTPVLQCGTPCSGDFACQGAKNGCTTCTAGVCSPPPPTVTPTPVVSCGTPCSGDFACQGAKNGCTSCTAGVCGPPATSTPAPTATPRPTSTPVPTATPTPIPPTPTPAFNPASCTCDGISYTTLSTGKSTTITSYAKITGNDALRGIITGQSFFLTLGADDVHGTVVAQSGLVPAVLTGAHYQSQWTFTLPQLISGDTYRIWSQISCQPKNAAYAQPEQSVAGASTQLRDTSLLARVASFFKSLFGIRDNNIAIVPTSAPTAQPVAAVPSNSSVLGAESIQMGTLTPIDVYQKTCSFIKFRYNF